MGYTLHYPILSRIQTINISIQGEIWGTLSSTQSFLEYKQLISPSGGDMGYTLHYPILSKVQTINISIQWEMWGTLSSTQSSLEYKQLISPSRGKIWGTLSSALGSISRKKTGSWFSAFLQYLLIL